MLMTAMVIGVAPRIWSAANAHDELPVTLPPFEALAQRTYVYDANGNEIAVYELENSQPISYANIPEPVIQAFLLVEDKEFFGHHGVNVRSLVRATLSNFASDSPQQGASTITMQVVKNDFLAGLERDGRYKLLQIHYARMLEREMPKEQILERYLNTVFFGNNAYGIQAAAETYFGKTADQLTFIESAFLAGLVRSPSGFDPINAPERSRARWAQVLTRLVDEGFLTTVQADQTLAEFVLPSRPKTIPTRTNVRTYFTEALRDYLLNKSDMLGDTYQERYNRLFRGGLRIHTTLDSNLQLAAEVARNELPRNNQGFDAAIVSLDSKTSAVRAMVGGEGFIAGRARDQHGLDRAADRLEHQVLHPCCGGAGGSAARRRHRRQGALHAAQSGQRSRTVRHHRRRVEWRGQPGRADVAVDQLRVRPPLADRRPPPRGRHHLPDGAVAVLVPGAARPRDRSNRSPASPPAPTR